MATGLWGGFLGLALAALTFWALGHAGFAEAQGLADVTRGLFHVPTAGTWLPYALLLAVPLAATVFALVTSRLALMRMLRG